jgi:hypothetical protein
MRQPHVTPQQTFEKKVANIVYKQCDARSRNSEELADINNGDRDASHEHVRLCRERWRLHRGNGRLSCLPSSDAGPLQLMRLHHS